MSDTSWYQIKQSIEHASGVSMDVLHVVVGLALFILVAAVSRRGAAGALPWLATLLLAVANEAYDLNVELWPDTASQILEGAKDIVLTMALPTLLWLFAQWRASDRSGGRQDEPLADDQVPSGPEVPVALSSSARPEDQCD